MTNAETLMTLDEGVAEVLGMLTGTDLQYQPESDRYQAITRAINRAMRAVAREQEWGYYADTANIGNPAVGQRSVALSSSRRIRATGDDAVRLVDPVGGGVYKWAYFVPRDSLHKYIGTTELKCAWVRTTLEFSRPFLEGEDAFEIHVPVMREPVMFRLPLQPEDPNEDLVPVPAEVREQLIDFDYPDLVIAKAAYFYAMTNPIMQPRVQTLEAVYKDIMYALQERDSRNTDTPYQNDWTLGISGDPTSSVRRPYGPHADTEQGYW